MFFDKDAVIQSLTEIIKKKNAKIAKLTKKKFDNYGNGKYLILSFTGLDPDQNDENANTDGVALWYREYDTGMFSSGNFMGYSVAQPTMIRNGSTKPKLFSSDNAITCVKDCEFNFKQLKKFYSMCLHKRCFSKLRYYQAKVNTVPALPVLKKLNLKE